MPIRTSKYFGNVDLAGWNDPDVEEKFGELLTNYAEGVITECLKEPAVISMPVLWGEKKFVGKPPLTIQIGVPIGSDSDNVFETGPVWEVNLAEEFEQMDEALNDPEIVAGWDDDAEKIAKVLREWADKLEAGVAFDRAKAKGKT